eukprot:5457340-Ditylum_brightwellii.AAC.1
MPSIRAVSSSSPPLLSGGVEVPLSSPPSLSCSPLLRPTVTGAGEVVAPSWALAACPAASCCAGCGGCYAAAASPG